MRSEDHAVGRRHVANLWLGNAGLTVLCPRSKIRSFVRPICHHCNPRGERIMLARKIVPV